MQMQPDQTILIVDDSPEDCEATRRALRQSGLANPIVYCGDGDEALDFLHRRGAYSEPGAAPRPCIILLDLNMPGTDGREVLQDIKGDSELKKIPVVVFTTSDDDRDVNACYQMGANSYIQKPVDLAGFIQAVQRMTDFWFAVVILPRSP
jgi:CheY-like chemotaxis protein